MFSEVLTVTVSPGANGVAGMKLPPSPSESATTVPVWAPLTEPVTVIVPNWEVGTPRNVICVAGEAKWPPGIGNAYTGGGPLGFVAAGGFFAGGFFLVLAFAAAGAIRHRRSAKTATAAA